MSLPPFPNTSKNSPTMNPLQSSKWYRSPFCSFLKHCHIPHKIATSPSGRGRRSVPVSSLSHTNASENKDTYTHTHNFHTILMLNYKLLYSQITCCANRMTGFYMKCSTRLKRIHPFHANVSTLYPLKFSEVF